MEIVSLEGIVKKGWLRKQGGKAKALKQRFVVFLKTNYSLEIRYYSSLTEKTPTGIILLDIEKHFVREVVPLKRGIKADEGERAFEICSIEGKVAGNHETYVFLCYRKSELDQWMSCITKFLPLRDDDGITHILSHRTRRGVQVPDFEPVNVDLTPEFFRTLPEFRKYLTPAMDADFKSCTRLDVAVPQPLETPDYEDDDVEGYTGSKKEQRFQIMSLLPFEFLKESHDMKMAKEGESDEDVEKDILAGDHDTRPIFGHSEREQIHTQIPVAKKKKMRRSSNSDAVDRGGLILPKKKVTYQPKRAAPDRPPPKYVEIHKIVKKKKSPAPAPPASTSTRPGPKKVQETHKKAVSSKTKSMSTTKAKVMLEMAAVRSQSTSMSEVVQVTPSFEELPVAKKKKKQANAGAAGKKAVKRKERSPSLGSLIPAFPEFEAEPSPKAQERRKAPQAPRSLTKKTANEQVRPPEPPKPLSKAPKTGTTSPKKSFSKKKPKQAVIVAKKTVIIKKIAKEPSRKAPTAPAGPAEPTGSTIMKKTNSKSFDGLKKNLADELAKRSGPAEQHVKKKAKAKFKVSVADVVKYKRKNIP